MNEGEWLLHKPGTQSNQSIESVPLSSVVRSSLERVSKYREGGREERGGRGIGREGDNLKWRRVPFEREI